MKKTKIHFTKPKQKFFGASISSNKSKMPTLEKRNPSWPPIQKPKFDSENLISNMNLNRLISCVKNFHFQTYTKEYNDRNNDTISDFFWQRLSWVIQEVEHNLILLETKKESDELIKDYFQNVKKLLIDNKIIVEKPKMKKQIEHALIFATEIEISLELFARYTYENNLVFERIESIFDKKEKKLFAKKLLNAKDREEKNSIDLTLAERLTIIFYLQEEGFFIKANQKFLKTKLIDFISVLLDKDEEQVKSAMELSLKRSENKINENKNAKKNLTPNEIESALNSLKKVKTILENLKNTSITDRINKRISILQRNSTIS